MILFLSKKEAAKNKMVSVTHSINMSFSELWEIVKDGESWHAAVHGVAKSQT